MSEWRGSDDLRDKLVPVETLATHPRNPRRGNLAAIADSLRVHGQLKPIVAHNGVILAGNHTYRAAVEVLGWPKIAVTNATNLSDQEAETFLLADNRTSDLGNYDDEILSAMLIKLQDEGRLEGTGYSADDVDDYLASLATVAESERKAFSDFVKDDEGGNTPQQELREHTLVMDRPKYEQFTRFVKMLAKEYSTADVSVIVFTAVEREARRL